jgi:hypothetical protein
MIPTHFSSAELDVAEGSQRHHQFCWSPPTAIIACAVRASSWRKHNMLKAGVPADIVLRLVVDGNGDI